jgi:ATP-binding cassette subfamily B protein
VESESVESKGLTVRRLLKLAALEKTRLMVGTVFLLIGSGAGLYFPALARQIIDSALESQNSAAIDRTAMILAVVFGVQGIAVALRYYLFTAAGERIVVHLRTRIYEAILRQEIGFFDLRKTGELTNRLSADAGVLQNTVSVNISMALRHLVTAIGGFALLFWTSFRLGAVMSLAVPLAVGAALFFGRAIRRISHEAQEELARSGEVAEESIASIRTVRSFGRESRETDRYDNALQRYYQVALRRIQATALFSGGVTMVGYGAIAGVLWYGGRLVIDDRMTVGDLTQFILYTLMVAASVASLGTLYADFMKARGAGRRIFELLDRLPVLQQRNNRRLSTVRGEVRLNDVSFSYPARPDTPVFQHLDLVLPEGKVVALVGASGGGKSTVASLIQRFYDPDDGSVTLDGVDYRELDRHWLRERIGVVSQEPTLLSTSIEENILYGRLDATMEEVEAAAEAANAAAFIESFPDGYQTMVGERGVQLSGGQRQRIAIARALLKDPEVLILDEATSALDAESEFLVQQALDRLMKGRTVLLIAHRLSTVMNADRIVVIQSGEVVEQGGREELLDKDGAFRSLVERQLMFDEA